MDRDAAHHALADIDRTRERALTLRTYAHAGPIFAVWGVAWFVMNLTRYFDLPFAGPVGAAAIFTAAVISMLAGKGRGQAAHTGASRRRSTLAGVFFGIALAGAFVLIAPADALLANAVMSWIVASVYAIAGLWLGARISVLGIVLAVVVGTAWFFARDAFELAMGVVGGGVLLITGLWLWRS
tara:strand:- start:1424 stop:1972 length:549 start_codon:yes stop_codon:yes gene_type:complete